MEPGQQDGEVRARGGGAGVDLVSEVVRELRVEVDVEDRDRCPGRGPAAVAAIGECGGNRAGGNGAGGAAGRAAAAADRARATRQSRPTRPTDDSRDARQAPLPEPGGWVQRLGLGLHDGKGWLSMLLLLDLRQGSEHFSENILPGADGPARPRARRRWRPAPRPSAAACGGP